MKERFYTMKETEFSVTSNLVKVDVTLDKDFYVHMRIYPLNAHGLTQALNEANSKFERSSDNLEKFIPDFVNFIRDLCDKDESFYATNPDIKNNNTASPYELMAALGENLGTLTYAASRLRELGYIEEQFILFDMKYNLNRISALTVLYSVAVALVRKATKWPVSWSPFYDV